MHLDRVLCVYIYIHMFIPVSMGLNGLLFPDFGLTVWTMMVLWAGAGGGQRAFRRAHKVAIIEVILKNQITFKRVYGPFTFFRL